MAVAYNVPIFVISDITINKEVFNEIISEENVLKLLKINLETLDNSKFINWLKGLK